MDKKSIIVLLAIVFFAITPAACSGNVATPLLIETKTPNPTSEPITDTASLKTVDTPPMTVVEPDVSESKDVEEPPTSPPDDVQPPALETLSSSSRTDASVGELTTFQSEIFDLSFQYPDNWAVQEDVQTGLMIESSAGYIETLPSGDGALIIMVPRGANELPGDNIVAKLASGILAYDLPGTADVRPPITTAIGDQQFAISGFSDIENDLDGFFAVILRDETVVFAFGAAGGEQRATYLPTIETLLSSIILSTNSRPEGS